MRVAKHIMLSLSEPIAITNSDSMDRKTTANGQF